MNNLAWRKLKRDILITFYQKHKAKEQSLLAQLQTLDLVPKETPGESTPNPLSRTNYPFSLK